jgi:hypothetical protein
MYCPDWVFDIACTRTASEFLTGHAGLEVCSSKYADGLSEFYTDVPDHLVLAGATEMLQFLAEIEAGEAANELLNNFSYTRMYYEASNKPRRMKPLFGNLEDGVKEASYSAEACFKMFKAYIFSLRSNVAVKPPAGWVLEKDEHLVTLPQIIERSVSPLDSLIGS